MVGVSNLDRPSPSDEDNTIRAFELYTRPGLPFPHPPQPLSSSQGSIEMKLCEIPIVGYFPPESFAYALSGVTT